jgi:hypothetical protein
MSSVSGLSDTHRIRARDLAMEGAFLALAHRSEVHYTQGSRRWQGIAGDLKAWKGEFPHYADCSSFATWCLWLGLDHYDVRDVVNGAAWKAGYTGTILQHGKRVLHLENVARGDLAIYGRGWPGSHVAICIGGGLVISHGSEAGPFKLPLHYRPDLLQIRRYI